MFGTSADPNDPGRVRHPAKERLWNTAMGSVARGERIARLEACSNVWDHGRCENPKRVALSKAWWFAARMDEDGTEADRHSGAPRSILVIDRKARERRSGEISIKAFVKKP